MSAIPFSEDVLPPDVELLALPDVAKQLGIVVTRVLQMLRDRALLAVKRGGYLGVPAEFFDAEGAVIKPLPGLISVLRDGGYRDSEILRWLFTPDDSLNGTPIAALHGHQAREVLRRAQAMAF